MRSRSAEEPPRSGCACCGCGDGALRGLLHLPATPRRHDPRARGGDHRWVPPPPPCTPPNARSGREMKTLVNYSHPPRLLQPLPVHQPEPSAQTHRDGGEIGEERGFGFAFLLILYPKLERWGSRILRCVEIQPNDRLGILLPLESLTLDVTFEANEAKEYSSELPCKSEISRQLKLPREAFAATALKGVSTATLHVMNSHVSVNRFTHAVPRTGKGEATPVGPTSFEFHVPEDCPVAIAPSVGTVLPGKKSLIQVSFRPPLSDQLPEKRPFGGFAEQLRQGQKYNIPAHGIHLKDAARDHLMFVEGGIPLHVPIESLAVTFPVSWQEALQGGSVFRDSIQATPSS
ncbi:cilia- and flagella-associated protein 74 [Rhynochetos jubatus]